MKKNLLQLLILFMLILSACSPSLIYDIDNRIGAFREFQYIPAGLNSLSAKSCGKCHTEIYEEWKKTMHSKAYTDPYFQAYWKKDKYTWSCLNCHTPLDNQQENRLIHFKNDNFGMPVFEKNEDFDEKLRNEGVTCVSCHLRDGVIYGPFQRLDMNAPHPVVFDSDFLSEKICLRCHQVKKKRFSLLKQPVCDTGSDWEKGPYKKLGYVCQHCHMPEVTRPLVAGFKKRKGRKHMWWGGNSPAQVRKAITIEAYMVGKNKIRIDIINSGAGHSFPTGDPDRKVFINIELINSLGEVVDTGTVKFERNIIWKPVMVESSDSRLPPKSKRSVFMKVSDRDSMKKSIIKIEGIYQIVTDRQRDKLVSKYGLPKHIPSKYKFLDEVLIVSAIKEKTGKANEEIKKK